MPSVMFNFRAQVPEDKRRDVLKAIEEWSSVISAALLKPGAKSELTQRMAYAKVEESADIERLVRKIAELPEIESASAPPRRKLV